MIAGAGAIQHRSDAMTMTTAAQPQVVRVADVTSSTSGIQTWTHMMELGGLDTFGKTPQTLFVPSDAAFRSIPTSEIRELMIPGSNDLRRAFLARGATDSRLTPEQIAGKRISVTTLDGRPLTIDATGEELMVGDAEALDVRKLPDGRVLFVLDQALSR
ncbi:MAG TPA: fasciclin domain-containing protein [Acetobacteraceae bacterium]